VIWDFRGQELQKIPLEKFKQFVWRLSKDDQKKIRKNLREYSRQFDEEDAAEESNVSAELLAFRRRLIDEWNAWRKRRVTELEAEKKKEGRVVEQTSEQDEEKEQVEEWVEELIDETEEVIVG
jgi:translation initiation factor 3 subunit B